MDSNPNSTLNIADIHTLSLSSIINNLTYFCEKRFMDEVPFSDYD